ncbi:hypothetical protein THAOC_20655 [Thalassiosira oceanica]|uniref:Uncharacterized protein n=1 Tax=Thalassiosira oceanica TaxID=159749 RepID=K0S2X0_THAOC|nr:hypothetical protein THAOC_20655 [Thalassiosira oceanica]|eukprot:EJK59154.1 hypothetical protein THAOC_20655 [Thalassiosira oceanica]
MLGQSPKNATFHSRPLFGLGLGALGAHGRMNFRRPSPRPARRRPILESPSFHIISADMGSIGRARGERASSAETRGRCGPVVLFPHYDRLGRLSQQHQRDTDERCDGASPLFWRLVVACCRSYWRYWRSRDFAALAAPQMTTQKQGQRAEKLAASFEYYESLS